MTGDQVKTFFQRWQAIIGAVVMTVGAVVAVLAWGDSRYIPREELGATQIEMLAQLDSRQLVEKADIEPIQDNLTFLTREVVKDRITSLDSRIQILESMANLSRDDRRTLNELRYDRSQLEHRLRMLE